MPHRNLIRGGSHDILAFYSGAQRGSPKVAGTRRAAPRPFRRALSYQALEAVLRRGTVPAEAARSDQSERPLGRDRADAAATHRNLRPRHRQASELRGGVITSPRVRNIGLSSGSTDYSRMSCGGPFQRNPWGTSQQQPRRTRAAVCSQAPPRSLRRSCARASRARIRLWPS
jgi:hypothetical protein